MNARWTVVSFFDYTGIVLRPWAAAGYECVAYDIQHPLDGAVRDGVRYVHADLYDAEVVRELARQHDGRVHIAFGFPPCTDLSNAGARWWAAKAGAQEDFQLVAAARAQITRDFAVAVGCRRWMIENPVGRLSTLWRSPDFTFHPHEYGGYLTDADAAHPTYPEVIPARDAYTKRTCIWHGEDFAPPVPRPVSPVKHTYFSAARGREVHISPLWKRLGGKSTRVKNIRAATPRGYAAAVYEANKA